MCGRFDTSHLTWAEIHGQLSKFAPVRTAPLNMEPNDDVRPTTPQLVAHLVDGAFEVEPMRWGLVPYWRSGKPLKDTVKGANDGWKMTTFNCRGETAATSSVFKGAYAKRRCLIPANAWYEWTGEKGSKIKHTFARADGGAIWFGGIWDRATTPDAGEVASFTILTHAADGWLTDYHDRAPLILEEADWGDWLSGSTALPHPRADRFHLAAA
jgi:putative SOS response-associated peptidase YedK